MANTWQCSACDTINPRSMPRCQACDGSQSRPTVASVPDRDSLHPARKGDRTWPCAICETVNSSLTRKCIACGASRPERSWSMGEYPPDVSVSNKHPSEPSPRSVRTSTPTPSGPVFDASETAAVPWSGLPTGKEKRAREGATTTATSASGMNPRSTVHTTTTSPSPSRNSAPPKAPPTATGTSPPRVLPPERRWDPPTRPRLRRRGRRKVATLLSVLLLGVIAFFTRHDWDPALHHLNAQGPATGRSESKTAVKRCSADVADKISGRNITLIRQYQTRDYIITLCRTGSGTIYYHGAEKNDTSRQITLPVRMVDGSYMALHDGYTYWVTKHDLVVTKGGQTLLDQALSPAS